jgi:uncharacterized membrane protein YphA (DoxX/SURF4 family)
MARIPIFPLLGAAFAVAGIDKLFALRGYRRMFLHWGWPKPAMRVVGGAEVAGGVLVACGQTRVLGGAVLAAASATVLAVELRRSEPARALPRLALLLAAVAAICPASSGRAARRA